MPSTTMTGTYVALCNCIPPQPSTSDGIPLLRFYIGERLTVTSHKGDWFFGHYEANHGSCGVFPRSHVRPVTSTTGSAEAREVVEEFTQVVQTWWRTVKQQYAERSNPADLESFIQAVKVRCAS